MNWYAPMAYLNRWADRLETRMPSWLQYNVVGDPISWVFDHPLFTLLGAGVGFLIARGSGASFGAWFMVGVYIVREAVDIRNNHREYGWPGAWKRIKRNPWCKGIQVGWLTDSIMDVVGPAIVALCVTWLAR